jgi:alpha-L-fucosidase
MTLGEQWGWQPQDTNYKSTHDLIHIFADVIGHGGNLLLGVGSEGGRHLHAGTGLTPRRPRQSGPASTPKRSTAHAPDCPTATSSGLPTLSADSTTLYLFLANGMSGSVEIKGLVNKIVVSWKWSGIDTAEASRRRQDQLEQGAGPGLHRCAQGRRR